MRYDRVSPVTTEISFAVASGFRGKGLGTKVLCRSLSSALDKLRAERIRAVVMKDNAASVRVFEKLGLAKVDDEIVKGQQVYVFEKSRLEGGIYDVGIPIQD